MTPSKTITKTIETLHLEMLRDGRLNLSPPYQRERCWKQEQNVGLINSIMLNHPLPLITLYKLHASNPDDAEAYAAGIRYECVDGQNRMWAIRAFLSGKPIINAKGAEEPVFWISPTGRKDYADMEEEIKELFNNYDIPITIVQESMSMDARKLMFTNMQNGSKISVAEYMRNTDHPVGKFIWRTGLRDRILPIVTGPMLAAKGEWMDMIADCVTLYRHQERCGVDVLDRSQAEVRAILKCKKEAARDTKYDMVISESDDAPLMALFEPLIETLTSVKAAGTKYHKFHAIALFSKLLNGESLPPAARLQAWFKSHKEVVRQTKEGIKTPVIYSQLLEELTLPLVVAEPKPKRRSMPKATRNNLWERHFKDAKTGTCQTCEKSITPKTYERGHVVAVAAKGTNALTNLVPICFDCNRSCGEENLHTWCAREHHDAPFLVYGTPTGIIMESIPTV
jgi:hypothetical protein